MDNKVYIIILNYNNWYDTIECLESVLRNDYPNYQVIVVDNNSQNNSVDYMRAWADGMLDICVDPKNPLRNLSFPLFQNLFHIFSISIYFLDERRS